MAYVAAADFRTDTVQSWTRGLTLDASEASNAEITEEIAAVSLQIDEWCQDHFETETAATIYVDGRGMRRIFLPKRVQTLTSVSTRMNDGTYTLQAATSYALVSSISGSAVNISAPDYLEVVNPLVGSASYSAQWGGTDITSHWPGGATAVKLVGNFSWPAVPQKIKAAVALAVWNHFKPEADILRRVTRFTTADITADTATTLPTGVPEADRIISMYQRFALSIA
jgi:hypothetical protein